MSSVKSLRTLVRLKERRIEQHDQALQVAKAQLFEAAEAEEAARSQEAQERDAELAIGARLTTTTTDTEGFLSNDVITLQMLLKEAAQRTTQATQATLRATEQKDLLHQQRTACERNLKRAHQQLEAIQLRLRQAQLATELAQEDAQDDEAEETAVARLLGRRRTLERQQRQSHGGRP